MGFIFFGTWSKCIFEAIYLVSSLIYHRIILIIAESREEKNYSLAMFPSSSNKIKSNVHVREM